MTLLDAFKNMKLWQIGVLAAVLVGAFGATLGIYYLVSGSDKSGLSENQQLIPVQLGNLVNEVSVSGSLVFPNRETLSFGTGGVVAEVFVAENQSVQEGEPLARLSDETIATLEQAVAQARIGLRNAEDALEEAKSPYTPLDLAKAEAAVSNARLALKNAQDDLEALIKPSSVSVAKAQTTVTNARLSVKAAQEAMDAVVQGASEDDVAAANSKLRSTATTLANSERDLLLAQSEWNVKLEAAQGNVDTTLEDMQAVYEKWFGVQLREDEIIHGPDALLESWGTDLDSIFDPNLRYEDLGKFYETRGSSTDDPATPWNEVFLYAWLNLYPGGIVATCESGTVPSETLCVQAEIDDAWDVYSKAQDDLDSLETQAAKAIASAEEAVSKAKESLADAEKALADMEASPEAIEIESKEKELDLALATLAQAEEDLAKLTGNPDPIEMGSRQRQVALAQATLDEAGESLAAMDEGTDPLDIALREADVVTAQATLRDAIQRLENATLKAPWNGIVTALNLAVGQTVNATTPVIEIVDPTVIEMSGIVDEIDVLFIQKGATARVTMDALPGQVLSGSVSAIASGPQTQQGVVSYPLSIQVQAPAGVQLPEGLSAVASVVIREETDVLLIPLQSLYGTFAQPVVRVMTNNGSIEERPVVLGNSDDFWAVVEGGLNEGDQVVMESQQASTSQFGFGGAGGLTGGFPGGGGSFRRVPGGGGPN